MKYDQEFENQPAFLSIHLKLPKHLEDQENIHQELNSKKIYVIFIGVCLFVFQGFRVVCF